MNPEEKPGEPENPEENLDWVENPDEILDDELLDKELVEEDLLEPEEETSVYLLCGKIYEDRNGNGQQDEDKISLTDALTGIDRWEHDVAAGLKPGQERKRSWKGRKRNPGPWVKPGRTPP